MASTDKMTSSVEKTSSGRQVSGVDLASDGKRAADNDDADRVT